MKWIHQGQNDLLKINKVITTTSPLFRNIADGLSSFVLPPSMKIAVWPKLQFEPNKKIDFFLLIFTFQLKHLLEEICK